jgi:neutral ceramidase
MRVRIGIALVFVFLISGLAAQTNRAGAGKLRVGVVRADITPPDPVGLNNLWENGFKGVHDKIYARVLVLDNGTNTAAIVAVDTVEFADATPLVQRVSKETGIPTSNIIMAATHDHNSPMISLTG